MNPGLISRRRLRLGAWVPDRGHAPMAAGVLLVAVAAVGFVSATARTPTPTPPQQTLRTVASVVYLPGTRIPAPPSGSDLVPGVAHGGRHVFRSLGAPLSVAKASAIFDYYLTTMTAGGWTLAAKADPNRLGEWTLKWNSQQQSTLLTLYTTPTTRLIVDACPPEPYC